MIIKNIKYKNLKFHVNNKSLWMSTRAKKTFYVGDNAVVSGKLAAKVKCRGVKGEIVGPRGGNVYERNCIDDTSWVCEASAVYMGGRVQDKSFVGSGVSIGKITRLSGVYVSSTTLNANFRYAEIKYSRLTNCKFPAISEITSCCINAPSKNASLKAGVEFYLSPLTADIPRKALKLSDVKIDVISETGDDNTKESNNAASDNNEISGNDGTVGVVCHNNVICSKTFTLPNNAYYYIIEDCAFAFPNLEILNNCVANACQSTYDRLSIKNLKKRGIKYYLSNDSIDMTDTPKAARDNTPSKGAPFEVVNNKNSEQLMNNLETTAVNTDKRFQDLCKKFKELEVER